MSRKNPGRRGFTLLELMFVLGIMGVLSTTAIAMFRLQQQRAKRTEAMTNLTAISKMQLAYYGENGSHPASIPVPVGAPGLKQNWDAASAAAFGAIGFGTEGSVFYVYDVNSSAGTCACPSNGCFTASAYGDADRDGNVALVGFFHADGAGTVCPSFVLPVVAGPPLDPVDGLPILEQPVDIFQFSGPIVDDY